MKNGSMSLHLSTKGIQVNPGEILPIMNGKLYINNFSAIKTPFIIKIVSLTSLSGIIDIITNSKEIKFNNMNAIFNFYHDKINLTDCSIIGQSFDLNMKGEIDIDNHLIKLRGNIVPSVYGVNHALKIVPVFGKLISGKRRGVISAPFNIKDRY